MNISQEQSDTQENTAEENINLPIESESESISKEHSQEDRQEDRGDRSHTPEFTQLLTEIENEHSIDAKLRMTVDFMENSLSRTGTPQFKNFWDARKLCLQYFRESISPAVRVTQWTRYSELSKEAQRLKEILDEQSGFAAEQIDMAIKGIEDEIEHFQDNLDKIALHDFPALPPFFHRNEEAYRETQRELILLNTLATRINSLRKELIKTEMRIRQKNKFFQRLSAAGDKVFPRRKDQIKEVSQRFTDDINAYISEKFSESNVQQAAFELRDEIKALQGLAKVLTLNTQSFTQTRLRLSECWDKLKVVEKERKKERAQQREVFKKNSDEIVKNIHELTENFQQGKLSVQDASKGVDDVIITMRRTELGRDELKELRSLLDVVKKAVQEKLKEEEQERNKVEIERDRLRKEKIDNLRKEIDNLLNGSDDLDVPELTTERDRVMEEINKTQINKSEKNELERMLKPLKDIIINKKERALLNLSDDQRQSLDQLRLVLSQRKERRQEIKNQIEALRRAQGSSGLDFEQAMSVNEQMSVEKERLDRINESVREIEQSIAELEG